MVYIPSKTLMELCSLIFITEKQFNRQNVIFVKQWIYEVFILSHRYFIKVHQPVFKIQTWRPIVFAPTVGLTGIVFKIWTVTLFLNRKTLNCQSNSDINSVKPLARLVAERAKALQHYPGNNGFKSRRDLLYTSCNRDVR